MIETAEQRARPEELLQLCVEQRMDATCTTPDCRQSSHDEAERACIDDWLAECSTLGDPDLDVDTLPYEIRLHFDTTCAYFLAR